MHVARLQASTIQRTASPYSRLDRPVSGHILVTQGIFIPLSSQAARHWFPYGCVLYGLTLATKINSLARYSKRTIQLRRAVSHHDHEISGSFYSLSRVLFNFPSRYLFAIGLKTYLELEVDAFQIRAQFPMYTTQDTHSPSGFPLRSYHPLWHSFPGDFKLSSSGIKVSPTTPHLRCISAEDSVCSLPFFLADTHGISIDFFSSRY